MSTPETPTGAGVTGAARIRPAQEAVTPPSPTASPSPERGAQPAAFPLAPETRITWPSVAFPAATRPHTDSPVRVQVRDAFVSDPPPSPHAGEASPAATPVQNLPHQAPTPPLVREPSLDSAASSDAPPSAFRLGPTRALATPADADNTVSTPADTSVPPAHGAEPAVPPPDHTRVPASPPADEVSPAARAEAASFSEQNLTVKQAIAAYTEAPSFSTFSYPKQPLVRADLPVNSPATVAPHAETTLPLAADPSPLPPTAQPAPALGTLLPTDAITNNRTDLFVAQQGKTGVQVTEADPVYETNEIQGPPRGPGDGVGEGAHFDDGAERSPILVRQESLSIPHALAAHVSEDFNGSADHVRTTIAEYQRRAFEELRVEVGDPLDERLVQILENARRLGLPVAPVLSINGDEKKRDIVAGYDLGELRRWYDTFQSGIFSQQLQIGYVFSDNHRTDVSQILTGVHEAVGHGSERQAYVYQPPAGISTHLFFKYDPYVNTLFDEARATWLSTLLVATTLGEQKLPGTPNHAIDNLSVPSQYFQEYSTYTAGAMGLDLLVARTPNDPDRELFWAITQGYANEKAKGIIQKRLSDLNRFFMMPFPFSTSPDNFQEAQALLTKISSFYFSGKSRAPLQAAAICRELFREMQAAGGSFL